MRELFIEVAYLAASVLFILGLKGLSSPATARRGIQYAETGMLLAIVGTLLHTEIVRFEWILIGLVIGSAIGTLMAIFVPLTAMPKRIGLLHMFGALAATLVGIGEYYLGGLGGGSVNNVTMTALGFEVMFGSLTITGSFLAFSKLQGLLPGQPITY